MKERLGVAVADAAAFVERWPAKALETIEPTGLRVLLRELAALRAARSEARPSAYMLHQNRQREPGRSTTRVLRAWVDMAYGRTPRRPRDPPFRARVDGASRRARPSAGQGDGQWLGTVTTSSAPGDPARSCSRRPRSACCPPATRARAQRRQPLRDRTLGPLSARFDDGTGERESRALASSVARAPPDRDVRRPRRRRRLRSSNPLPVLAHCYNSLVADRLAVDHLRHHDNPMEKRTTTFQPDRRRRWSRPYSPRPRRTSRWPLVTAGRRRCSASSG